MRVVRSLLHPGDLARLVEREYELAAPVAVKLVSRGFNDAYLVTDQAGERQVLRIYSRNKYWVRSDSDLLCELELLDHLASSGRAVAHPYRRRTGELLGLVEAPEGERGYALFTFASGRPGSERPLDPPLLRALGAEIARLHAGMDTFRSDHGRYRIDLDIMIDGPLAAIEPYVKPEQRQHFVELESVGQRLREAVAQLPSDPPTYGLIHGDIHDDNLHVATDGEFVLFDFDHCGLGWRAYDLTNFSRGSDAAPERERWTALLAGYESVRPLSRAELDALPFLTACRELWDVGDWLRSTMDWQGDGWVSDRVCEETLERVRRPLATLPE